LLDPIEQVLTGTFLQVMDSIRPCLPAGLSLTEPPLDMLRHTGGLHTKEYRDVIFGIAYPHSGACALMEIGRNQVRLDVFYEEHQAISITEDETHIHVANNGFMPLPPGKIWQHAGIGMRSIVSTEDMRRTVLEILALFLDTVSRGELILHQRMLESKTEAPHQRRPDAASRNALKHPR
jgi:hypothetical protein